MVTHENEMAVHAKRVIRVLDGKVISDTIQGPAKAPRPMEEVKADEIIDGTLSKKEKKAREIQFLDYLRQAAQSMTSHKMRSFYLFLVY